MNNRFSGAQFP